MAQEEKIPLDLYEELLHRLPSNDLMNFKRVFRDWNELIFSQRFIRKQLRRSQAGCDGTLIVTLSPSKIIVCSNPTENRRSIPYPQEFSGRNTKIVCSWDGLVLNEESAEAGRGTEPSANPRRSCPLSIAETKAFHCGKFEQLSLWEDGKGSVITTNGEELPVATSWELDSVVMAASGFRKRDYWIGKVDTI